MATNRSRRLRKKLCVDEFQEVGFELNLSYPDDLSDEVIEAVTNNQFQIVTMNTVADGIAQLTGQSLKEINSLAEILVI